MICSAGREDWGVYPHTEMNLRPSNLHWRVTVVIPSPISTSWSLSLCCTLCWLLRWMSMVLNWRIMFVDSSPCSGLVNSCSILAGQGCSCVLNSNWVLEEHGIIGSHLSFWLALKYLKKANLSFLDFVLKPQRCTGNFNEKLKIRRNFTYK